MALEIDYDGLLGAGMIVSDGVVIGSVLQRGGGEPYRVELLFAGPGGDVVELLRTLPEVHAFTAGFLAALGRGAAQGSPNPADEIIGQIEERAIALVALKSRVEELTKALENLRRDIGQRLPDRLNAKQHLIEQIERALAPSLEQSGSGK